MRTKSSIEDLYGSTAYFIQTLTLLFQVPLEVKVGASIGTDSSESERLQLKASLHGNHAFSWD